MGEQLQHYGVPGMKWGVRKDRYKSLSRTERKASKEDFKKKYNAQVDAARGRLVENDHRLNRATQRLNDVTARGENSDKAVQNWLTANNRRLNDAWVANTAKFGKEATVKYLAAGLGGVAVNASRRREASRILNVGQKLRQG